MLAVVEELLARDLVVLDRVDTDFFEGDALAGGACAKLATLTPSRMQSSTRSFTSAASDLRFTPKGLSVRDFTSAMAVASSSMVIVADARIPSPPAALVAAVSLAPATQPIPVWMMG